MKVADDIFDETDDLIEVADDAFKTADNMDDISILRQKASSSFDKYLTDFKNSNGTHGINLPKSRLTDAEWARLNDSLEFDNVRMVEITKNGSSFMKFEKISILETKQRILKGLKKIATELAEDAGDLATDETIESISKYILNKIPDLPPDKADKLIDTIKETVDFISRNGDSKKTIDYVMDVVDEKISFELDNIIDDLGDLSDDAGKYFEELADSTDEFWDNMTNNDSAIQGITTLGAAGGGIAITAHNKQE